MNLPYIDRIWRAKGAVPLEPSQSAADAFGSLDPLLQANGTTFQIDGDTLTFDKVNPAAQDKMATFTKGTLRVVDEADGRKLAYDMTSPALFWCFVAPLFFLAFAVFFQYTAPDPKKADAAKEASEKKDEDKKPIALNPIDKFLGAPEPDKPGKDDEDKGKKKSKGPSPTPAYVFAGLFAFLYLVGRFLEPYLVRREFRRRLRGEPEPEGNAALAK